VAGTIDINFKTVLLICLCFVLLASQLNSTSINVKALHYSALLGGFAVVMSNGRAAFLTASSLKFEPSVSCTISAKV